MTDHYYSVESHSESQPQSWETQLAGMDFQFLTDNGVFSKEQVDFGSKLLIETSLAEDLPPGDLLDMGCGYGPLGLALAKAYPDRQVHMVDVNQRALDLAEKNADLNGIENVKIYPSDAYAQVEEEGFAAILSNPPIRAGKKLVHQILEEAYHHLREGGRLLIVIQKKQGAPSARKKMEEVFANVDRIALDSGYWILQSIK